MLSTQPTIPIGEPFIQFASTDGLPGGPHNAIGDYSVVAQDFIITPLDNVQLNIHRMIVQIEASGNFAAVGYGPIGVLTNGVRVQKLDENDNLLESYTCVEPIVSNAHWARYSYDLDYVTFGAGNNYLDVRWSFDKAGAPIHLALTEKLAIRLNDDFTALAFHHFTFQGVRL